MSFGRKAAIAVAAFATVGSTLFGGAALAGDDWSGHGKGGHGNGGHGKGDKKVVKVDKKEVDATAGRGGDAGNIGDNCFSLIAANVTLPLLNFHSPHGDQAAGCSTAGNTGGSPTASNQFN